MDVDVKRIVLLVLCLLAFLCMWQCICTDSYWFWFWLGVGAWSAHKALY